ncbi:putative arrestin domain-containing protein [Botryosphaeria dothidea]|uniref:Arrestin domain-containing protein n=1 Tax=Botryosphaeria dothidea TaxID=55169 RepID=A0A8H4J1M9_9PEZI|nr:putative arrestin domain-containing protein [Botryosphaeria dothidea]
MDIRIVLDPHSEVVTTGDTVTGRVILDVRKKASVTSVDVKLRGYIKTSLLSENDIDTDTWRPYHDKHEVRKGIWGSAMTLSAGQHDFPFELKLPTKTTCGKNKPSEKDAGSRNQPTRASTTHKERGLPPSFMQVSDEVEIAYSIKATAVRPDLFKDNLHTTYHFNFRPIEQAWDPVPRLTSVKHQHQFDLQRVVETSDVSPDDEYFPDMVRTAAPDRELASILVDARLPKPAIIFCNHDIPLDITIRKVNAFSGQLYLQSFQITLIGYTQIQTQAATRRKVDTWVVTSNCNLDIPIGYPEDGIGAHMALPPALWRFKAVPPSVTPSFHVCGVSRTYELEITLGLTYESPHSSRPGTVWLPLRQPVDMYQDFPALPSPANISIEKLVAQEHSGEGPPPPSYEMATKSPY